MGNFFKDAIQKQKDLESQQQSDSNDRLNRIMTNDPNSSGYGVSGSFNEVSGRLEGLERAKTLTGQNPYEIGKDYQEAYGNIKKRSEGTDTASELLRANKSGAVAEARTQMQQQGVKGGAALGAVSQIERAKSYDVNNQLVQAQKEAQSNYLNAAKANANFTQSSEMNFGQMAAGKDVQAPPQNSNGFGTVICTELNRQGYFDAETFALDQEYGHKLLCEKPHVYFGYLSWARYLVPLMKMSKIFTHMVAVFAVPWAKNMAGKKNRFGKAISIVGEFGCGIIGRLIISGETYAVQKTK